MNIVYLYTKLPPYQIPVFRELINKYSVKLSIIYWDHPGNSPFIPPDIPHVAYYKRSSLNYSSLKTLLFTIKPDLIFISGWQDILYLICSWRFKIKSIPVVIGFDDIWNGTFRQIFGAIIFRFILKRFYTHAWVSGPRQYEYAKRFNFKDSQILYYLYSCDTDLYQKSFDTLLLNRDDYPKTFLYVGRLVPDKAIDILVEAFKLYREKLNGSWRLLCIGNGPLYNILNDIEGIDVLPYMDQKDIIKTLPNIGAFVLPSRKDVSPLVLHEFCTAGLPIILSDAVGSKLMFLINGFNGYSFRSGSPQSLSEVLSLLSNQPVNKLIEMGINSNRLSLHHNHKFVAASLISVLESRN
jgi:glycosyltransferase involved in cell wall biosynthesis